MSAEILCFNGLVFAQYSVYTVAIFVYYSVFCSVKYQR